MISHLHSGTRSINQTGVKAPLLVPSFSSRGFPEVASLYGELRYDLYGTCLISAFDLSTKIIATNLDDIANILLLDSGVYETQSLAVAADGYNPAPTQGKWDRDAYRAFLKSVPSSANVLAVSFDHCGPVEHQIELAIEDFFHAPSAASDFLLKPLPGQLLVQSDALTGYAARIARFSVLGITEKELGASLLDRCRALVTIRAALSAAGTNTPIHVFGTITPGAILSYFFSGADIFDGLNWLRFAYQGPELRPIAAAALDEGEWEMPDWTRFLKQSRLNLRFLRELQDAMHSYCASGDLGLLANAFPVAVKAARVSAAAGGKFSGSGSV